MVVAIVIINVVQMIKFLTIILRRFLWLGIDGGSLGTRGAESLDSMGSASLNSMRSVSEELSTSGPAILDCATVSLKMINTVIMNN